MPDTDAETRTVIGLQIKLAREQRRWSQAKLADMLNRATGFRSSTTAKYVSKWECGERNPGYAWAPVIEQVLDLDLSNSDATAPDEGEPAADDASSVSLESVELIQPPVATLVDGGPEDDPMRRRTVLGSLGLAGSAALGSASHLLEPVRRQLDAALAGPVTEDDAVEWERAADQHSRLATRLPAEEILPELVIDIDEVRHHLESASDELRPRLLRVSALLSGLVAISLVSAGHWTNAERFWRRAERTARHSGDRVVRCQIAGKRAVLGLYVPGANPATVLSLADHALRSGDGTVTVGTMSALAARAQALSLLGARREARETLAELQTGYEVLDDSFIKRTGDSWGWPEPRLHHVRSFVYSHLGSTSEAIAAQDAALKAYTRPSAGGAVQIQMHRARSAITSGDPSQGVRHIVATLEQIEPSLRHGYVATSAEFALQALPEGAKRLPEVREARALMSRRASP